MDPPTPGWPDAHMGLVTWIVLLCELATPESSLVPLLPYIALSLPALCICPQQAREPLRRGRGLTPHEAPGLGQQRLYEVLGMDLGVSLGVQGQPCRRLPMITLTSGVRAGDSGCPRHYLSPSHMLTGTLRRCLDQTLSILSPGVMTSRPHSVNGHHSRSLMTAEALSPQLPCVVRW